MIYSQPLWHKADDDGNDDLCELISYNG